MKINKLSIILEKFHF